MTQLEASMNRTVATPRVASVAEVTVVLLPASFVVTAEQVIVRFPDVLLYNATTSPAANIDAGTVIPADNETTLPTSAATSVVVVELIGVFRKPNEKLLDKSGSVAVTLLDVFALCSVVVPAPEALP